MKVSKSTKANAKARQGGGERVSKRFEKTQNVKEHLSLHVDESDGFPWKQGRIPTIDLVVERLLKIDNIFRKRHLSPLSSAPALSHVD
ncbi:hypothetical protein NPIL_612731 [Nephila pilipes]|uniref:Uncharacterized protein n=1 Tax=Nephila pilipes TaxID=299642 RepID=A0A8X6QRD8_NEPPI|nr:hypothetical protein NPIL_612731 [Nephila pilipes]